MCAGMSTQSRSLTAARIAPGARSRGASDRSNACVLAITRAAGRPCRSHRRRRPRPGRRAARGSRRSRRRPASRPVVGARCQLGRSGSTFGRNFCWISCATWSSCSMRSRTPPRPPGCRTAGRPASPARPERRAVEQPLVVARVLLLRQPRPEVEHADQLAARDERHDEHDARLPHLLQRRRLELEPGDVHGAGCALEHRQHRVVGRDVEGRFGDDRLTSDALTRRVGRRAAAYPVPQRAPGRLRRDHRRCSVVGHVRNVHFSRCHSRSPRVRGQNARVRTGRGGGGRFA